MRLIRAKKKVATAKTPPRPPSEDFDPAEVDEAIVAKPVKAIRKDVGHGDESLFRRYLRDVSDIDVMAPEQEFALARRIEGLKVDLWAAILCFQAGAGVVIDGIELHMPERFKLFDVYKRSMLRASSGAAKEKEEKPVKAEKSAGKAPSAFDKKVLTWAESAGEADPEGIFLELTAEFLLERPEPVQKRVKNWSRFAESVRTARRRLRDAKNYFVKANLRLVLAVAARYSRELLSFEDLVQEGNIGLMKAVDRYDYRRGFRFSTYASWWIRHAIGRALADKARLVRLPVHVLDSQQKIEKTRRKLLAQLGRKPSSEEISAEAGLPLEEVQRIVSLPPSNPVSLDEPYADDDDGRSRLESLADPDPDPEPVERMEAVEKESAMLRLLGTLKPVEVDILRKRFGLHDGRERTLQEIGDEHSLSRERIRQVQDRALSKLRMALTRDFSGENSQLFG
ncbi:MAG: sigma-70 family RNA polymerase sigma factor [Deltaproteobacteria bacterium]|nr:sigma-70 family RNA polymerase sigma factor [Deltaproteobacteria bacterium]